MPFALGLPSLKVPKSYTQRPFFAHRCDWVGLSEKSTQLVKLVPPPHPWGISIHLLWIKDLSGAKPDARCHSDQQK